jgi:hypothetical protein
MLNVHMKQSESERFSKGAIHGKGFKETDQSNGEKEEIFKQR